MEQAVKRTIQFNNDSDEEDIKPKPLDVFKKRQIIKFSKN